MFGLINPGRQDRVFRRAYARCCQHQRRRYGLPSLAFLSYESVLLYLCAVDGGKVRLDELRRVQSVTDAALAYLAVEDLLDELLIRVRDALNTDTAAILLLKDAGTELVARAAKFRRRRARICRSTSRRGW